jgi:hypothetical protein
MWLFVDPILLARRLIQLAQLLSRPHHKKVTENQLGPTIALCPRYHDRSHVVVDSERRHRTMVPAPALLLLLLLASPLASAQPAGAKNVLYLVRVQFFFRQQRKKPGRLLVSVSTVAACWVCMLGTGCCAPATTYRRLPPAAAVATAGAGRG